MANGSAVNIARADTGRNAAIVEHAYEAFNTGDIGTSRNCSTNVRRGTPRDAVPSPAAAGGAMRSLANSAVKALKVPVLNWLPFVIFMMAV